MKQCEHEWTQKGSKVVCKHKHCGVEWPGKRRCGEGWIVLILLAMLAVALFCIAGCQTIERDTLEYDGKTVKISHTKAASFCSKLEGTVRTNTLEATNVVIDPDNINVITPYGVGGTKGTK